MDHNTTNNPMNPPYGQPALVPPQGPPVVVIQNQEQPVAVINPNMFKTTPIALTCMFCKKPVTTNVRRTCNVCACLLCYFTGLVFYVCVQCCRGKDICCYDAEHTCPQCGNVVGTYNSC